MPSSNDISFRMRHREQAVEHVVSLVSRSGEGFTASKLVADAEIIARYLDDAVVPVDVHGNPVESP